ncbi:guanylate kinase [compost metagenome]
MIDRGDSEEAIQKRLSTYEKEIENIFMYDEVVINHENEFEETRQIIKDIISEEA